jgi:DNA replication protein DnaC
MPETISLPPAISFLLAEPGPASRIWRPLWLGTSNLQGKRARFYSVVDVVNQLDAEKRAGRAGHLANRLLNQDTIELHELGYLPFSADGGALPFHLISKLYLRASLIVSTNLSFGE